MEGMEYFYELFEALPRGGPGDNKSTRRAFNTIPKPPEQPLILDIGCGPGVQTIELAKLSKGRIIALDNHQAFLDKLIKKAKKKGLLDHIVPNNRSMLDMDFEENTFDIIWSEGALYFMGFQNGLRRCHQLLKNDGFLAVTEIVYLVNNPPPPLIQYFEKEYPDIKAVKDKIDLIQNERFHLISNFTLPESSWLDSFYLPMEEEIIRLNKKYQGNEIASGIFEEMKNEINLYKKFSDFYGYEFFIMQRIN
ncbi:MAG: class I SAM-dependent methyltransferase [Deltaproteobacteria bacterium]|nr:class I SAM-dependent methyltransferase [Deltaproteobacteria bacterium]